MPPTLTLTHDAPWLIARFAAPQRLLSWSLNRPGLQTAERVAWLQIDGADLGPEVDPQAYLNGRLAAAKLEPAIGLLTSRDLDQFQRATVERGSIKADSVITLGLSNAERVGARRTKVPPAPVAGTINLLCHLSKPLSESALLEALSIATQARTTAILELGHTPDPACGAVTGTGTDCIVIACPIGEPALPFAGLHTDVGEAIGAAVFQAADQAARLWLREKSLTPKP